MKKRKKKFELHLHVISSSVDFHIFRHGLHSSSSHSTHTKKLNLVKVMDQLGCIYYNNTKKKKSIKVILDIVYERCLLREDSKKCIMKRWLVRRRESIGEKIKDTEFFNYTYYNEIEKNRFDLYFTPSLFCVCFFISRRVILVCFITYLMVSDDTK